MRDTVYSALDANAFVTRPHDFLHGRGSGRTNAKSNVGCVRLSTSLAGRPPYAGLSGVTMNKPLGPALRKSEATEDDAEQLRQAAEAARQEREHLRDTAEAERAASEEARHVAEDARHAAEDARQALAESVRATTDTLDATLEQMKVVEEMRRTLRELKDVKVGGPN